MDVRLTQIPFEERGRTYSGCDCYGFVRLVLLEAGVELPLYAFNGEGGDKERALELIQTEEVSDPEDNDLVYLTSRTGQEHIGVFNSGNVWHMTSEGVLSRAWKRIRNQVKGIYRVTG